MTNTPRVPNAILSEMKQALLQYYPEFQETIHDWTSSNSISTSEKGIEWSMFSSYGDVFRKMENFVQYHGIQDSMILVFSSAITVRGKLGDVSRVRRFFQEKNISVNSNHKLMKDDSLFISTANSSKGLERKHVFCFLTFPLELAFANFSNDILMNLLTVAISRCKSSIHFCLPSSSDRFSPILRHYSHCPEPSSKQITYEKSKQDKKDFLDENLFKYIPYLLEKEHSMTEIIRLQMLRYPTREKITSYAKKFKETPLPSDNGFLIKTEEEATIIGLVFETMILSQWKNTWPPFCSVDTIGHSIYHTFSMSIKKLYHEWILFSRQNPFHSIRDEKKIEGAILFSKLHLGYYQKIFCSISKNLSTSLLSRWNSIKHISFQHKPPLQSQIQTQHSVRLPFMNGIIDILYAPSDGQDTIMEIYEIKASKSREWKENALLQAILYGICKKRKFFRVHLFNVFSSKWLHYSIHFKNDLDSLLLMIRNDLQLNNLNCYLSKNSTIRSPVKQN